MTNPIEILDAAFLDDLGRIIEDESDVILLHAHYRGASAPTRLVFGDIDKLRDYIRDKGRYGDRFYVWKFESVCTDDNLHREAIIADEHGEFPKTGPY